VASLHGWQWLFLLEAIPAIVMGIIIFRTLPDSPSNVGWLQPEERQWLTAALAADAAGNTGTKHESVLRAISDRRVLMFGLAWLFFAGAGNAYLVSMPQILGSKTGMDANIIGQIIAIGGSFGVALIIGLGWQSDKRQERFWHVLVPWIVTLTAIAAMTVTTSHIVVIVAALLVAATNLPSQPVFFSALTETLHERHRAVGVAAVNTFGQFGSFLGVSAFGVAKDATGSYDAGLAVVAVSMAIGALLLNRIRSETASPR
jgi:ACS family tartrate transporter-like MFS transporter